MCIPTLRERPSSKHGQQFCFLWHQEAYCWELNSWFHWVCCHCQDYLADPEEQAEWSVNNPFHRQEISPPLSCLKCCKDGYQHKAAAAARHFAPHCIQTKKGEHLYLMGGKIAELLGEPWSEFVPTHPQRMLNGILPILCVGLHFT